MKQRLFLAGATGSIGQSALDILRNMSDKFQLVGFSAHRNLLIAKKIINEFKPEFAIFTHEETYKQIKREKYSDTKLLFGIKEACKIIQNENIDIVLNSIVGGAGLIITHYAVENVKRLALANKESLVIAGDIIIKKAKENECEILPVDSEHNAVFQALSGETNEKIRKIWLTASGGPFLHTKKEDFCKITLSQALKHPNWDMGSKITIDSATMMNKGLEVIEAHHLFEVGYEKIYVVIHPESVIHSMVEFVDGNFIAQLGKTDMRGPIQYSLTYPERERSVNHDFDLFEISKYHLIRPDFERFPCLLLAYEAGRSGLLSCNILNAANEAAVYLFLNKKIHFTSIPKIVSDMLEKSDLRCPTNIDEIIAIHDEIKKKAIEHGEKEYSW